MTLYLVGLAGPGGVGKSTTAYGLVNSFQKLFPSLKVDRMAFADPLYETASNLTGIPIEKLKSQEYKEIPWTIISSPMPCLIGWTPRKFLQIIGTECFRQNVNTNFWVQSAIRKAEMKKLDIVIMEDSRFENEYSIATLNIELERDGIEYACNHASAMPPDPKYIDFKIELTPNINYDIYAEKIYTHIKRIDTCGR